MTRQMTDDEVLRVLGYAPGPLDESAPQRVWLQIDTFGDNDSREELWPGADHVTWQDESIGGLEIVYVRADLHAALQAERDALRAEQEHNNALIQRQSDLLTGAVNVLRGDPPADTLWSHHDVAELAREMKARAERAESALEALRGQVAGLAEKWQAESNALPTLSHKGAGLDRGIKELSELLAIKERMG